MAPTRRTATDWVATFREHLTLKHEAKALTTRSDALKKRLKDAFNNLPFYENENGSKFVDLPKTITVGGKSYQGMEMRRSVKVVFNEDKAEALLARKEKSDPGITEAAQSTYIDQDKIYRLQQEGRITEKELDSLLEDNESFSFWPVEGEVI